MLILLLLGLLIYTNMQLAKKKGKNQWVWALITFVAFFAAYTILGGTYLSIVYKGQINREAVTSYLLNSPLVQLLLMMFGVGGVLLVRYILERSKPGGAL
jgi:ABC-type multidrug transport system permease subunit